jgi:DNA-binding NarL/FixJ family response regulator
MSIDHQTQAMTIDNNGTHRQATRAKSDNVGNAGDCHSLGPNSTVPISIVSNNRLLREGLVLLLSDCMNLLLVGSYPVEQDLVAVLPNPPDHLVLVDGSLDRELVLRWLQYWRSVTPPASVLVLELPDDCDLIVDYIEAGASGYTLQGASASEVVSIIQRVLQKTAYCSPEVAAELFARLSSLKATVVDLPTKLPLTAREFEVLRCIADGFSNQDIANKLVIEVRTVKHHVHNILKKLNLSHRWDAARLAIEHGWLPEGPSFPDPSK